VERVATGFAEQNGETGKKHFNADVTAKKNQRKKTRSLRRCFFCSGVFFAVTAEFKLFFFFFRSGCSDNMEF
jgi:hypothetical protein